MCSSTLLMDKYPLFLGGWSWDESPTSRLQIRWYSLFLVLFQMHDAPAAVWLGQGTETWMTVKQPSWQAQDELMAHFSQSLVADLGVFIITAYHRCLLIHTLFTIATCIHMLVTLAAYSFTCFSPLPLAHLHLPESEWPYACDWQTLGRSKNPPSKFSRFTLSFLTTAVS